jgi:hypothetical protein
LAAVAVRAALALLPTLLLAQLLLPLLLRALVAMF